MFTLDLAWTVFVTRFYLTSLRFVCTLIQRNRRYREYREYTGSAGGGSLFKDFNDTLPLYHLVVSPQMNFRYLAKDPSYMPLASNESVLFQFGSKK